MNGVLTYWVKEGEQNLKAVKLTICADEDCDHGSVSASRRRKLTRMLSEASAQGCRLTYSDLSMIMLTSRATLKRDVSYLRRNGLSLQMERGTRKRKSTMQAEAV